MERKRVFKNIHEGEKAVGVARKRWLDEAVNSLKKMCVRSWRKIARDRDVCKLILLEARILRERRAGEEDEMSVVSCVKV